MLGDWRFQLKTGSTSDFQAFDTSITNTIGKVHSSREETDPGCWLTFGRIQKICNIWLKYHFVLYFSGSDGTFTGDNTWLESLVNYVHVPIDRKVLESLSPKHSEHTKLGNNILSWKRDLQEPRYLTLQKILRYEAKEKGYNSALHYEMDIIWT